MKAVVQSVQDLFGGQHRYVVPAYQRAYVWDEDKQWEPLWADVERATDSCLDESFEDHFLGAIVIRVEKTPPGGITEWSVIDGQQRLTTIQLMLAAIAESARQEGFGDEALMIEHLIHHSSLMADGDERFKFWPTKLNRGAFAEVVAEGGPGPDIEDDANNTIHEAFEFFMHRAKTYAYADVEDETQVRTRYAALRQAITGLLQIVTIYLEKEDPAQVIFETLNARGTPLLAMDLVKNALFDLAAQQGEQIESLHDEIWEPRLGDTGYWSEEIRLGRMSVPRTESFLMHWLAMKTGEVVQSDEIFVTFQRSVLSADRVVARDLIDELTSDATLMRSFDSFPMESDEGRFFKALHVTDTTTFHPVALLLFKTVADDATRNVALRAIESYLIRRLIMGMTTKNYNKLAARMISNARRDLSKADRAVVDELIASQADSAIWPLDTDLTERLVNKGIYGWVQQRRLAMVLGEVEKHMRDGKTERITELPPKLQIEHIMPQSWQAHWPIEDATPEQIVERETRIQQIGNLTLITPDLNLFNSNDSWDKKKAALGSESLLMLNRRVSEFDDWDEKSIETRGREVAEIITSIWPGPQSFMPEDWSAPEPEYNAANADIDAEALSVVLDEGSDLLQSLLINLAETPGVKRTFPEIETALAWPRQRLASVCGGYGSKFNERLEDKRPWHINLRRDGVWEMWMDERVAVEVLKKASRHVADASAAE
jgi:hypothetical protein